MFRAVKTRIKLNDEQKRQIDQNIGSARWVYNHCLALKIRYYRIYKRNISWVKLANHIVKIKHRRLPWLNDIYSQLVQQELQHLDKAYQNFFRSQNKYPKFKKKRYGGSYSFPAHLQLIDRKHIKIPKIGMVKSGRIDKSLQPRTTTISRDNLDKYWCSFIYEVDEPEKKRVENVIGIDLGLSHFLITDDGTKIDNPKFLKKNHRKIKSEQQKLSRKQKTSRNRNKQRLKVAKAHQKTRNKRNDWQNKLSRKIVDENQVIITENLSVKNMMKNRRLSQAISDVGWSEFIRKLNYKSDMYGSYFLQVDRKFPSTKLCSYCGHKNTELKLSDRFWFCSSCGTYHDRDINAARNIKSRGWADWQVVHGTPVESLLDERYDQIIPRAGTEKQEGLDYTDRFNVGENPEIFNYVDRA